jgi:2-oxoglutarate dehydrogenase E2 component (dihydrolipoamide succinyltransferase)
LIISFKTTKFATVKTMAAQDVLLPKMGESIAEATIIRWLKAEGESVELDEPIVEIATDKVDSEVPSPFEGVLVKHLYQEGDVVAVGAPLCQISGDGGAIASSPNKEEDSPKETVSNETATEIVKPLQSSNGTTIQVGQSGDRFYSPLVLNIARTEGVSMQVLENIQGTGKEGRVTLLLLKLNQKRSQKL